MSAPNQTNNLDLFLIKEVEFTERARSIYQYQRKNNPIFGEWCTQYPTPEFNFLPISFFKSRTILTTPPNATEIKAEITFSSSGTTSVTTAKHLVLSLEIYEQSFIRGFEMRYGSIEQYCYLGLLPSYLERSGSSLIYMVSHLIKHGQAHSGFYLNQYHDIANIIERNELLGIRTILFGVTFALLKMIEQLPAQHWKNTIVIETGGMKGHGPELTRNELHEALSSALGCSEIHSEYGMTELLSQAYATQNGRFVCPPWMQIRIQDPSDPRMFLANGKTGRICVIDLANLHSCSFIATDDLGKCHNDGSFEVLGRIDFSDLRGCNQLVG